MPIDEKPTNIVDIQYEFLKVLCSLFDGDNFVEESKIREIWPECPSHNTILNIAADDYFTKNYDIKNPAYMPTAAAIAIVRDREHADTAAGNLQKLQQDFDKYRAEEAAYHAAEALREKRAEKRGFRKGILTAVIAGVIVAIFSYCLPGIVSLISRAVHLLPSLFRGPR